MDGNPDCDSYYLKQTTYLNYENEALIDSLDYLKKHSKNTVLDTTGSVVYLQKEILERLKNETLIVYIKADEHQEKVLLNKFLAHPKPIVWGNSFKNNFETDYKELLQARDKKYCELADVIIYPNEINSLVANDLISLIDEKLKKGNLNALF